MTFYYIMSAKYIKSEVTNDKISFNMLNDNCVQLNIELLESIKDHIILIEKFIDIVLSMDDVKHILIKLPANGKRKVNKKIKKIVKDSNGNDRVDIYQKTFYEWNNYPFKTNLFNIDTVSVNENGTRTVKVNKENFIKFYQSNCDRILLKAKRLFKQASGIVDSDGFELVSNKFKAKKNAETLLRNELTNISSFMKTELKKQSLILKKQNTENNDIKENNDKEQE